MLLFKKVKEKKIHIILIIIFSLIVGVLCSLKLAVKEYIASSTFLIVETEKVSEDKTENVGNLEISNKLLATLEEIIKSDTTASKIKSDLFLDIENSEISKNVTMRINSKTDTIEIIIKNSDEINAVEINKKMLEIFSTELKGMYNKSDIYIIDNAHLSKTTSSIPVILAGMVSICIGTIIGFAYVVIVLLIEKNIRINKNIEKEIDLKKIIEIPKKNEKKNKLIKSELISHESLKSQTSKAFRNLRSNIQFMTVNNEEKKIILVTSPLKGEGKSYVTANMAVSFAEAGKKVILIDSDMASGRQSEIFNIPNNLGLSNYLSNLDHNGIEIQKLTNNFINETTIKNLNLITSGTVPPNTSELLASERLEQLVKDLSVFYDVVIIDGTQVLNSMDALILARVATSTVLVSDYKKTKKEQILKAKRDIQNVGGKPIGIIINRAKVKREKLSNEEIRIVLKTFIFKIKEIMEKAIDKMKEKRLQKKRKLLMEAHIEREIKRQSKIIVENAKNAESNHEEKIYNIESKENLGEVEKKEEVNEVISGNMAEKRLKDIENSNSFEELKDKENYIDEETISKKSLNEIENIEESEKDLLVLEESEDNDKKINIYIYKFKKDILNLIKIVKPVVKKVIVKAKVATIKVFVTIKTIVKKSIVTIGVITKKGIQKAKPVVKNILIGTKNTTLKIIRNSKDTSVKLIINIKNKIKEKKENNRKHPEIYDDQLTFDTIEMQNNKELDLESSFQKGNVQIEEEKDIEILNSQIEDHENNAIDVEKQLSEQNEIKNKKLNNIIQLNNETPKKQLSSSAEKINSNIKSDNKTEKDNIKSNIKPINSDVKLNNEIANNVKSNNLIKDNIKSKVEYTAKKDEIKKPENKVERLEFNEIETEKTDTAVLVIVDAEKGCCRVFGKCYYTEKLIKGIDKNDGFNKNQYSSKLINSRIAGLISLYGLTKKQAQRVDTLIYTTLCDYDDRVWLDKKTISNRADTYVLSMAKEYTKSIEETNEEYLIRCKRLRQEALQEAEIDIEYKLDNIWKSDKITLLDKFAIKRYANIYEVKESQKNHEEIVKSNQNKNFYIDIIQKVKSRLESNVYVEDNDDEETENSGVYELEEGEEKLSEITWKREEKQRKKEERLRKKEELREKLREKISEKRELMLEKKEEIAQKKHEKNRKQEELKRQKEEEKERQREEARIEEELLGDNLYPKTKNNRSLQ